MRPEVSHDERERHQRTDPERHRHAVDEHGRAGQPLRRGGAGMAAERQGEPAPPSPTGQDFKLPRIAEPGARQGQDGGRRRKAKEVLKPSCQGCGDRRTRRARPKPSSPCSPTGSARGDPNPEAARTSCGRRAWRPPPARRGRRRRPCRRTARDTGRAATARGPPPARRLRLVRPRCGSGRSDGEHERAADRMAIGRRDPIAQHLRAARQVRAAGGSSGSCRGLHEAVTLRMRRSHR